MTDQEVIAHATQARLKVATPDTSMSQSPAWAPPVDVPAPTQDVPGATALPQWLREGALPAIGMAGGARGGVPGIALGSMGGEALNQVLGITKPSAGQIAAQGEAALGGSVLGAAGKAFIRVGGPWMAEQLNKLAPEAAATFLGKFAPAVNPRGLFEAASKSSLQVPVPRLMEMINRELPTLTAKGAQPEGWAQAATELEKIRNLLTTNGWKMSSKDVLQQHQALGELMAGAKGNARKTYANLYHQLGEEVDTYISSKGIDTPAAMQIKQAWMDYKRQATVNEIMANVNQVTTHLKNQGNNVSFNGGRLLDLVEKNRFFDTAFSETEKADIRAVLGKLNTIPALRPGAGQQFGSGQAVQALKLGAMTGGGVGFVSHDPFTAGAAAAVGIAIPPVANTIRNIWTASQTGVGRALLRELIQAGKGDLTPRAVSVLAAFAESTQASPGSAQALSDGMGQGGP